MKHLNQLHPSILLIAGLLSALAGAVAAEPESAVERLDAGEAHAIIAASKGLVLLDVYADY